MSAKPASLKIRRTRASLAKANGPGASGSVSGRGGACLPASRSGRMKKGFCFASRQQAKASRPPGFKAAAQVGEGARRVGEEHDAEPGRHEVGCFGLEGVDGGVGAFEPDRQAFAPARGRARASARKCRAPGLRLRGDACGEVDRRRAAAAADVDHALARLRARRGDQPVGNRAQHLILMLLMVGPFLSGDAVPVFGLGGVVGVERRGGHGASRFRLRRAKRAVCPFRRHKSR